MAFSVADPLRNRYLGPLGPYGPGKHMPLTAPGREEVKRSLQERRNHYSPGIDGFGRSIGHNLAYDYGFSKGANGWEFAGIGKGGVRNSAWARDFTKVSAAQGKGATALAGAGYLGKGAMRVAPLLFLGHFAHKGWQEGGVIGAAKGVGEYALYGAAFSPVMSGVQRSFSGVGTMLAKGHRAGAAARVAGMSGATAGGWGGAQAGGAAGYATGMAPAIGRSALLVGSRLAMRSLAALPVVAPMAHMGMAINKTMQDIDAGHRSLGINTTSSLAAFATKGAWTSRQMSVQAIQRSHLNARSALGNEAQYMHRRGF